ncbi:hypothetical protein J3L16_08285 [Alteromonas sp. 5E99-2]|uniref:hypothetical protein n=1 Tax=Alteromonas sp. 5E99-2 TaxID=2817683 RepID=UPI001A994EC2|nr:hypothetical protein [Alteromonas sp. 5E99-2]MBO1255679.1 hypothetical protein [Alteromonas sp. 5E99-2]
MQVTYLSRQKAQWIQRHPVSALNFLMNSELVGELHATNGEYKDAIVQYGCAFEIASILLKIYKSNTGPLRKKIASLALTIYRLCILSQTKHQRNRVIKQAIFDLFPNQPLLNQSSINTALEALASEAKE